MEELQKVYEARAKKLNKIEELKKLRSPQDAFSQLEHYAKNGYESICEEDKDYFLKCFGLYDKNETTPQKFMIRVRISGGHLSSAQARALAEIAQEYGQDYIDITTRAQIEFRYIDIKDIVTIFEKMASVGISSYQTGVDNFRNIVNDPLDEMGFDNILPSQKLLIKLQEKFLHNYEWIAALPRKFNTSITGSISNRCNAFGHDCCFVLAQKNGRFGYNLYLGGKVGKIAKNANIFLANEDEVLKAYDSLIYLFREFGFRDNRNKNRLSFLIESVGMEEISRAIRERAGFNFQSAGETMTKLDFNDPDHGKVELKDGSFALHVVVPSGIFSGGALMEAAKLSEVYGNSQLRFDIEQSLYIMGVKDVDACLQESFFKSYKSVDSIYKNHLIACAGSEHCPFGVIENKPDAIKMAEYLEQKVPIQNGRVRMYWSGCVKGCGIHGVGDIGFEGCKVKVDGEMQGAVNISIGGKLASFGVEGYTVLKQAPLSQANFFVETLMVEYAKQKGDFESFEEYAERVLSLYSSAYIGFMMRLGAYLRVKNIDIDMGFSDKVSTGKNEEYEVFELGRKLYYKLCAKEAYSSYERFTNTLKGEKLQDPRELCENIDENLAILCEKILNPKEQARAVVFSELVELVALSK